MGPFGVFLADWHMSSGSFGSCWVQQGHSVDWDLASTFWLWRLWQYLVVFVLFLGSFCSISGVNYRAKVGSWSWHALVCLCVSGLTVLQWNCHSRTQRVRCTRLNHTCVCACQRALWEMEAVTTSRSSQQRNVLYFKPGYLRSNYKMLLHFISLMHWGRAINHDTTLYVASPQSLASVFRHSLEASNQTCFIIERQLCRLSFGCVSGCTTRLRFQTSCDLLKAERQQSSPSSEKTVRASVVLPCNYRSCFSPNTLNRCA